MLSFCILASGSSGNCSVIWTEKAVVLIDCGCSLKYITEKLLEIGINPQNLTAAVITHAHIDHIHSSSFNFLCKHNIPVYFHENILNDVRVKYGEKACNAVSFDRGFNIEDISIEHFEVHHKDSRISKTLGFTFLSEVNGRDYKIGYVTDTGKICENIVTNLSDSNILVIESNYDKKMLAESSRPYENKKWVLSDWGHLANEDAAKAIAKIKAVSTAKDSLKYVFLAHISKHHNSPEMALRVARETLNNMNISDINLFATKRNARCRAIKIS
ncbi:MAG: MBL fold metallo-hydrolase [Endomicrobia bacterium]|nr:MBL fold metallo-hydrolase [Endomicrobiia bacterium]